MRTHRLLIFVCMLLAVRVAAQQPVLDSLKKLLAGAKEDSAKANNLLALSKAYISTDPAEAIRFADSARGLSERINYRSGIGYGYKNAGNASFVNSKFADAIINWEKALEVFRVIGDKVGEANILSNEGALYFDQSDDEHALEFYLKALKIAEQTADT